jgi:hypothetical protein
LIAGSILVLAGTVYWGVNHLESYGNYKINATMTLANALIDKKIQEFMTQFNTTLEEAITQVEVYFLQHH